jgi:hypothetical protein
MHKGAPRPPRLCSAPLLLLPALNAMFDITTTLPCWVSVIDLEYPRLGLVRMDDSDEVLVSLRKSVD